MKICIIGDVHFCQYSSILRSRGEEYSTRLENCIKSINWAEEEGSKYDLIVYLGDFFDRSDLNSEEISALSKIEWNNSVPHYFLCGNHEMGRNDLFYNSAKVISCLDNFNVISEPTQMEVNSNIIKFLPYVLESNREELSKTFSNNDNTKQIIMFSHNDIAGIQMGSFLSTIGYEISELEFSCDICFNGHLHNGQKITDKIINVGNLTGQNFSEDAYKYQHNIYVLNTDDLTYEIIENPCAINFYKLDITQAFTPGILNDLKSNSVITIKCQYDKVNEIKQLIDNCSNIIESRVIVETTSNEDISSNSIEDLTVDHLQKFSEFVIENLGNSDIILAELEEVLK